MDPNIFFTNFEMLAEAPNGVQKLRELILQLAIRGKLVPQSSEDEPASVLIDKIKTEKRRLVKEKKIRKTKSLPPIEEEGQVPYEIPSSWKWTNLSECGTINPRNDISDDSEVSFIPMKCISERYGEKVETETRKWGEIKKGFTHFAENDVVLAKITPCFQNGKSAVVKELKSGYGAGTTELHVFRPLNSFVTPEYVLIYIKSPDFIYGGIPKMTGSAGQKRVPKDYFSENPFPLPPLAEQKRIVAKVDELMTLCDQLEARQQKKKELRSKLNSATLDKMLSAESQDEFEENWRRICENFDLLYDNPENVEELRKAVLQLAVQGKLVEQDEGDEPASVLIEKIGVEKRKLVKEGKIKKSKAFSVIGKNEISQNEMLCSLPNGWEWIQLGELGEFCGGGTPSKNKHEYWDGNVHWVSPKDMKESRIKISEMTITEKALEETRLRLIPKNSILIVARSGILKRLLPVSINDIECTVNQDLKVIIPFCPEVSEYLQLMLKGYESFILKHLVKGGMTVQSLKYTEFENHPFPIPPLNEQKRIVEKVDQLMGLCDELEAKLRKEREESERLMEAVVRGLIKWVATEI